MADLPAVLDDPSTIGPDEFHPAARAAYRWLKGFMITNKEQYMEYKTALAVAALSKNRQAQICVGTIERLRKSQPVSDRYLLGLCWTILYMHNTEAIEKVASARWDPAYSRDESEYLP